MWKIEIDTLYCSPKNEQFSYVGQMKYLQSLKGGLLNDWITLFG